MCSDNLTPLSLVLLLRSSGYYKTEYIKIQHEANPFIYYQCHNLFAVSYSDEKSFIEFNRAKFASGFDVILQVYIYVQGVLAFHDFTIHDPRKFMIFFKHQFHEFLANS